MSEKIDSAKAGVIYGAVGGVATWIALSILSNKLPDKKVDMGSVILATFTSGIVTTLAINIINEAK